MPNAVHYIGTSPNAGDWDIGHITGQQFEDLVAKAVRWYFRKEPQSIQVTKTRRVNDGGKDIVIRARGSLSLFGFRLQREDKPVYTTYIECKYTSSDRLDGDFRQYIGQFEDSPPDYFILATNSTVTPYNQLIAAADCREKQCTFLLADKYILHTFLRETLGVAGVWAQADHSPLVVEYQTDRDKADDNRQIRVYLSVRNYRSERVPCDLRLVTNENWAIREAPSWGSDDRAVFLLEPMESFTTRLTAERTANIGLPDLRITLNISERPTEIRVHNSNISFDFTPPLTGRGHRDILNSLQVALQSAASSGTERLLISISGSAGIGKSRILEELRAAGTGFLFDHIIFFGRGSEAEAIDRFLVSTGFTSMRNSHADRLEDFLIHYNSDFENRAFIFEDLHHASRAVIDRVKHCLLASGGSQNGSTVFLFTGRNDFTFPNEDYFSLLELFSLRADEKGISGYLVSQLTDIETRTLVQSTIQNIPAEALEKICQLSENTPFYVVQVIEYLLEISLARLVNRNTIGIPEVEKANVKEALPGRIQEIYEARFESLRSVSNGPEVRAFLIAVSFFGFIIPRLAVELFFDGLDNEDIFQTLIGRRFLQYRTNGDLTFSHENLLHFLRDYSRRSLNCRECAEHLLGRPTLVGLLPVHDRGELFYLAGRLDECVDNLNDIRQRVAAINNFSSEDLQPEFFPYMDCLFRAEHQRKASPDLLRKLVLAEAYMAVHNFAVSRGVEVCRRAVEKVKAIGLSRSDSRSLSASLLQLEAHGLLNVGRTFSSWKIMQELEAETRLRHDLESTNPELVFDLFDRLQELYKKWNHYSLSAIYGKLAQRVADKTDNNNLRACSAITFVGMDLYTNPDAAYQAAKRADALATQHGGAYRLGVYTGLSLRVLEALQQRKDSVALAAIRSEARGIVEKAATKNLPDSLMRAQLLLATLTYCLAPEDRRSRELAKQYVDAGLNASFKYGNGLFVWLLFNLRAVISMAEGGRGGEVDSYFNSAIESLSRQSLFFLGNLDMCYPNIFVLSNIVRHKFAEFGEREACAIIRKLESYESYDKVSLASGTDVLEKTLRNGILFKNCKKERYASFIDPLSGYMLPVI
jgi:hypothetical protein